MSNTQHQHTPEQEHAFLNGGLSALQQAFDTIKRLADDASQDKMTPVDAGMYLALRVIKALGDDLSSFKAWLRENPGKSLQDLVDTVGAEKADTLDA